MSYPWHPGKARSQRGEQEGEKRLGETHVDHLAGGRGVRRAGIEKQAKTSSRLLR